MKNILKLVSITSMVAIIFILIPVNIAKANTCTYVWEGKEYTLDYNTSTRIISGNITFVNWKNSGYHFSIDITSGVIPSDGYVSGIKVITNGCIDNNYWPEMLGWLYDTEAQQFYDMDVDSATLGASCGNSHIYTRIPTISISCMVRGANDTDPYVLRDGDGIIETEEIVRWTRDRTATGGDGTYTYEWILSGEPGEDMENWVGSEWVYKTTYDTHGEKFGWVKVTSAGISNTFSCGSAFVDLCDNVDGVQTSVPEGLIQDGNNCVEPDTSEITAVCSVKGFAGSIPEVYRYDGVTKNNDEILRWLVNGVTGGDGTYTYDWNLDGGPEPDEEASDYAFRTRYQTGGEKGGTVTVSSAGISNTFSCGSAFVDLCDNVDGVQTSVPEGLIQDGNNCVEPDPVTVTCDVGYGTFKVNEDFTLSYFVNGGSSPAVSSVKWLTSPETIGETLTTSYDATGDKTLGLEVSFEDGTTASDTCSFTITAKNPSSGTVDFRISPIIADGDNHCPAIWTVSNVTSCNIISDSGNNNQLGVSINSGEQTGEVVGGDEYRLECIGEDGVPVSSEAEYRCNKSSLIEI